MLELSFYIGGTVYGVLALLLAIWGQGAEKTAAALRAALFLVRS